VATGASKRGAAEWLFAACGVWLLLLGIYFIFVRPALLPEDLRYVEAELAALRAAAPRIELWLNLVFTVMGGFMAGAGVLLVHFALYALPCRPRGTLPTLSLTGLMTVGLMSGVNFALHSDFRWLLAAPALAWIAAVLLLITRGRGPR
jgi:hypothetical protein